MLLRSTQIDMPRARYGIYESALESSDTQVTHSATKYIDPKDREAL